MKVFYLVALVFCAGCVSMPKSTALLSVHLGKQISESKRTHEALIEDWAHQRRERTEAVLRYHLVREFIIKFLKNPVVAKDLDGVVCSDKGQYDRAIVMQDIVQAISGEIEKLRGKLFGAIEEERRALLDAVLNHYAETERMHRAITANIQSVVKGQEFEREIRQAIAKPLEEIVPLKKAGEKLDSLLETMTGGEQ